MASTNFAQGERAAERERLRQALMPLLRPIADRVGRFSRDRLEWAQNVIDAAARNAYACIDILENTHIAPCWCCGNPPTIEPNPVEHRHWQVICDDCYDYAPDTGGGPDAHGTSRAEAIQDWNDQAAEKGGS